MSIEKLKQVSDQILSRQSAVKGRGEEATKQALVLPMLDALGYDIWNPEEVCPEYEADFAIKKGGQKEKVDLAISLKGLPKIYFEVKSVDTALEGHQGQLGRYFNATPSVSLGVLTNGMEWRFFTDTGDSNIMDNNPFHVAKLDAPDQGLEVMARFAKSVFSPEAIRDYATELKYTANIANLLRQELDLKDRDPSEHFIRWILKSEKIYEGVVNINVVERFRPIVKTALTRVVREIVRRSLTAMEEEAAGVQPSPIPVVPAPSSLTPEVVVPLTSPADQDTIRPIVTTENELRAFEIVKGIYDADPTNGGMIFEPSARKEIPIEISYKDTTGYFGIYFNKSSWWIVRLVVESKKPWVGFNIEREKFLSLVPSQFTVLEVSAHAENRVAINSPEDLLALAPLLLEAMKKTIEDRKA